jgi:hypothetical protein
MTERWTQAFLRVRLRDWSRLAIRNGVLGVPNLMSALSNLDTGRGGLVSRPGLLGTARVIVSLRFLWGNGTEETKLENGNSKSG